MSWLKRLDDFIQDKLVHLFGGYTLEDVDSVRKGLIEKCDEERTKKEALVARLSLIENDLMDIKQRKLIAYSVPDGDWTPEAMKFTIQDLAGRVERLTDQIEARRKRASERARAMPRDPVTGKWLRNE